MHVGCVGYGWDFAFVWQGPFFQAFIELTIALSGKDSERRDATPCQGTLADMLRTKLAPLRRLAEEEMMPGVVVGLPAVALLQIVQEASAWFRKFFICASRLCV